MDTADTSVSPASVPLTVPPAPAAPTQPLVIGVDMAKDKFDLAFSDGRPQQTLSNDSAGIEQAIRLLNKADLIVVESTGSLQRPLVNALLDAALPVALVHPRRVRHLAKALGMEAKTDRIDADVLVRFGQLAKPRLSEQRSRNHSELAALVVCRRQLAVTRVQQSNRLSSLGPLSSATKAAMQSIKAVIRTLDKQIDALDRKIRKLIEADDDFKHLDGLLQSVPGVGPGLSATLAAELRELGDTNRRQVGALAGVAPFNCDSGRHRGKRMIRGDRTAVRCVLYMATIAAIRCNPVIIAFSDRLKIAGKISKVRIVACMRKLLTLLNAMVRDGLRWEELDAVKKLVPQP